MKIVVFGATGTIGKAVAEALAARHEVVRVSRHGPVRADLEDPSSVRKVLESLNGLDAVVCCAGSAAFRPLARLEDADLQLGLRSKLMGQVNLVRAAMDLLKDGGSITLTSGVLAREPAPGGVAISMVNAAVEAFAAAAALELPRGLRVNVVSPPWIAETLVALKMDPSKGISAAACARAYVAAVEGKQNGQTLDARQHAKA